MTQERPGKRGWRARLIAAMFGMAAIGGGSSIAADNPELISPDAMEVLEEACTHLAGLKAFAVSADIDNEVLTRAGQKLQFSSAAQLRLQRPDRLHVSRKGRFADAEYFFDGNTITLHGKRLGAYAQIDSPGTIDEAIHVIEMETGLDAPGADLLFSDPHAILSNGILEAHYLGTGFVQGVECHHLAFREKDIDWQLWVKADGDPLPMKYVITSTWQTGAPQYSVKFRNWDTKPRLRSSQFKFSPPSGSRKLEDIPIDEMGEIALAKESGR